MNLPFSSVKFNTSESLPFACTRSAGGFSLCTEEPQEARYGTVYMREQGRHINAERVYHVVHEDPDRFDRLTQDVRADMSHSDRAVVNHAIKLFNTTNNREIQTPEQLSAALRRHSPLHVAYRIDESRPAPAKRALRSQPALEIVYEDKPCVEALPPVDRYKHTLASLKSDVCKHVASETAALPAVRKGFPLEFGSPVHQDIHTIARNIMAKQHENLRQLGATNAPDLANKMSMDIAQAVCNTNHQMLARQPEAAICAEVGRSPVWAAMQSHIQAQKDVLKPQSVGKDAEYDSDWSSCDEAPAWTTARAGPLNLNVNLFVSGKDSVPASVLADAPSTIRVQPTEADPLKRAGFEPYTANDYDIQMNDEEEEEGVQPSPLSSTAAPVGLDFTYTPYEDIRKAGARAEPTWKFVPYDQAERVEPDDFELVQAPAQEEEEFDLVDEEAPQQNVGRWLWWKKRPCGNYTGEEPPARVVVFNRQANEGLEVWVENDERLLEQVTSEPIPMNSKGEVWLRPGRRHVFYRRAGSNKNLYEDELTFQPNTRYSIIIGLPWATRPMHLKVPFMRAGPAPENARVRAEMPQEYVASLIDMNTDVETPLSATEYMQVSPGVKKLRIRRGGKSADMPQSILLAPGQASLVIGNEKNPGKLHWNINTEADTADDLYDRYDELRRKDVPGGMMFLNAETGKAVVGNEQGTFHKPDGDECHLRDTEGNLHIFDAKRTTQFDGDSLDSEPMSVHAVLAHPHQPRMTVVLLGSPSK